MEGGQCAKTELAVLSVHHTVSPVLVSVALYHLGDDEENIDEDVDYRLLAWLFRPIS